MTFINYENIHQMVKKTVDQRPTQTAYRWFLSSGKVKISWSEFYSQVKAASKSLMALGVKKGDKVSILSDSCYRWVLADFATNAIGAVTVGIYHSNLANDCAYIINHSDAAVIFAENKAQLEKLQRIRDNIPQMTKVILFNDHPAKNNDWAIRFDEFLSLGKDITDEQFTERTSKTLPDDPACIVYTSGTTGAPKGAVLTHDNLTFTSQSVIMSCDIRENDETFLFLPLAHVFARLCVYAAIQAGNATTFNRDMDNLATDLKAAKPHWIAAVPRIFEKIQAKVNQGVESKSAVAKCLFQWAMDTGSEVSEHLLQKKQVPIKTALQYRLAEKLVFKKLKEAFGGRLRWAGCGAAPLNPAVGRFFHAAGILILEGFGMSENSSFTNVNPIDNYRFGWVGPPVAGVEHKIAEDGEVMFKGRNVMKEYYKMPDETAETLTKDGWQHSGDLGEIDSDNFLKITGRKKDIIITAGGKNIAPAPLELSITSSPYINQACVLGDQRKFLVVLVTLDEDAVTAYAEENHLEYADKKDLAEHPEIYRLLERQIEEANKAFPSYATVKKFAVVPEFTIDSGLLTPTFKLKKNEVFKIHRDKIDSLYPVE